MDLGKVIYPGLAALFTAAIFYVMGLIGKAALWFLPG